MQSDISSIDERIKDEMSLVNEKVESLGINNPEVKGGHHITG
jgi:hypothetical protein